MCTPLRVPVVLMSRSDRFSRDLGRTAITRRRCGRVQLLRFVCLSHFCIQMKRMQMMEEVIISIFAVCKEVTMCR